MPQIVVTFINSTGVNLTRLDDDDVARWSTQPPQTLFNSTQGIGTFSFNGEAVQRIVRYRLSEPPRLIFTFSVSVSEGGDVSAQGLAPDGFNAEPITKKSEKESFVDFFLTSLKE